MAARHGPYPAILLNQLDQLMVCSVYKEGKGIGAQNERRSDWDITH